MPILLNHPDMHGPVVDAALSAAADMLGMEVVYIGGLTDEEFALVRLLGGMPGIGAEGSVIPRTESLCHHMVAGATPCTAAAPDVPDYAGTLPVRELGVTSYVGVPIRSNGKVVGTLCGIDRTAVTVPPEVLRVLTGLAAVVEAYVAAGDDGEVTIRRSGQGWRVGGTDDLDLTSAMSLGDLLAAELPAAP